MKFTIINDTHLGVMRSAGTTHASAQALSKFVTNAFEMLVKDSKGNLVILGDLFDTYNVPNGVMLEVHGILAQWLRKDGNVLHLVAGNHDLSKDSTRLSSFELLGRLLQSSFDAFVVRLHLEPGWLSKEREIYVIPHLANQDLFNLALEAVPPCSYLLLHANYDNHFAEQSDHSLNVSEKQAAASKADVLVFAHEHQQRSALNKKVIVIGNQIQTSIADCLGNDVKFLMTIDADGAALAEVLKIPHLFSRRDWRGISAPVLPNDSLFIRVEGEASANEAADVVSAISKFRGKTDALVVTNAVRIAGMEVDINLPVSLETAKSFDVLSAILESLSGEEQVVVKKLLETQ